MRFHFQISSPKHLSIPKHRNLPCSFFLSLNINSRNIIKKNYVECLCETPDSRDVPYVSFPFFFSIDLKFKMRIVFCLVLMMTCCLIEVNPLNYLGAQACTKICSSMMSVKEALENWWIVLGIVEIE